MASLNLASVTNTLLQEGMQRPARLYTIERLDGTVHRVTDHDSVIVRQGTTYNPGHGFDQKAVRSEVGLRTQNYEGLGIVTTDEFTVEDLARGKFRGALVTQECIDVRPGLVDVSRYDRLISRIGEVSHDGEQWVPEFIGLVEGELDEKRGMVWTRGCPYHLGDRFCNRDLTVTGEFFTQSYDVDTVSDSHFQFTTTSGPALDDDWFKLGHIDWLSGNNAGERSYVSGYIDSTNQFSLIIRTPASIQPGDNFNAIAGCDGLYDTCDDKFDNIVNANGGGFGGLGKIAPTSDQAQGSFS